MSFSNLKPYFRARLNTLKLEEWHDAFLIDNIPLSKIDKAYHVDVLPGNYQGTAHGALAFSMQIKVEAFFKGYKTNAAAIDKGLEYADSIIKECCKSTNRLTQAEIKNILPSSVDVKAISNTNNSIAVIELVFNCLVILDPDN